MLLNAAPSGQSVNCKGSERTSAIGNLSYNLVGRSAKSNGRWKAIKDFMAIHGDYGKAAYIFFPDWRRRRSRKNDKVAN